ncbi:hypothetical protein Ae406Ps2_6458 [Pseudonocardia sp. Ae406_Ps2]|nr:hypothetical protein Ae406Ps2_6458 [Pseudonocardia sp. Ae406_Ps2]
MGDRFSGRGVVRGAAGVCGLLRRRGRCEGAGRAGPTRAGPWWSAGGVVGGVVGVATDRVGEDRIGIGDGPEPCCGVGFGVAVRVQRQGLAAVRAPDLGLVGVRVDAEHRIQVGAGTAGRSGHGAASASAASGAGWLAGPAMWRTWVISSAQSDSGCSTTPVEES